MGDTEVSLHTPVPIMFRGGGTLDQLISKVASPAQIFISGRGVGGGGSLDITFLKYLSGGTLGFLRFEHKIILSGICYMCRD